MGEEEVHILILNIRSNVPVHALVNRESKAFISSAVISMWSKTKTGRGSFKESL